METGGKVDQMDKGCEWVRGSIPSTIRKSYVTSHIDIRRDVIMSEIARVQHQLLTLLYREKQPKMQRPA